jgi:hypothetical protein
MSNHRKPGIVFSDAIARRSQQVSIIHLTSCANTNNTLLAAVFANSNLPTLPPRGQYSIAA